MHQHADCIIWKMQQMQIRCANTFEAVITNWNLWWNRATCNVVAGAAIHSPIVIHFVWSNFVASNDVVRRVCISFRYPSVGSHVGLSGLLKRDNCEWSRHSTSNIHLIFLPIQRATAHLWQIAIWPTCLTIFAVQAAFAFNSPYFFVSIIWQFKSRVEVMHIA